MVAGGSESYRFLGLAYHGRDNDDGASIKREELVPELIMLIHNYYLPT